MKEYQSPYSTDIKPNVLADIYVLELVKRYVDRLSRDDLTLLIAQLVLTDEELSRAIVVAREQVSEGSPTTPSSFLESEEYPHGFRVEIRNRFGGPPEVFAPLNNEGAMSRIEKKLVPRKLKSAYRLWLMTYARSAIDTGRLKALIGLVLNERKSLVERRLQDSNMMAVITNEIKVSDSRFVAKAPDQEAQEVRAVGVPSGQECGGTSPESSVSEDPGT